MNNRDDRFGRGRGDRDMDDREMGGRWEREREMQGRGEVDWDRARMDDERFGGASRGRQLSGSYGVRDERNERNERNERPGYSHSWDQSYGANRNFSGGIGGGAYSGRDWRDNNTVRDFGGGFGGYGNQAGGFQAGRMGQQGSYEYGGDAQGMYDRREQRDYGPRGWNRAAPTGEISQDYNAGRYGMRGERWGEERYGTRGGMDRMDTGYYDDDHPGRGREGMMGRIGHWFERKLHMRTTPGMVNRGPKNYRRSDDRIREDVCDRLMTVDWLDTSDCDITVASGEVTLNGTVPDRYMKRYIEEVCESVLGVTEVQNMLRVRRPEEQMLTPTGGQVSATTGTNGNGATTSSSPVKPPDKTHRA